MMSAFAASGEAAKRLATATFGRRPRWIEPCPTGSAGGAETLQYGRRTTTVVNGETDRALSTRHGSGVDA